MNCYRTYQMAPDDANKFNDNLRTMLGEAGYNPAEMEALLTSVASTGLLSSASAWGGLAYVPTPWLKELCTLANLEAMTTKSPD
jgi:hypothetical protein